jgi:Phasin protein
MAQLDQDNSAKLDKATALPEVNFVPAGFPEAGRQQIETLVEIQKEFFNSLEEMNRAWGIRVQSQLESASEAIGKLTATRSIPEAAAAYQECVRRQLDRLAEDSRQFLAENQKLMSAAARFLPKVSA